MSEIKTMRTENGPMLTETPARVQKKQNFQVYCTVLLLLTKTITN